MSATDTTLYPREKQGVRITGAGVSTTAVVKSIGERGELTVLFPEDTDPKLLAMDTVVDVEYFRGSASCRLSSKIKRLHGSVDITQSNAWEIPKELKKRRFGSWIRRRNTHKINFEVQSKGKKVELAIPEEIKHHIVRGSPRAAIDLPVRWMVVKMPFHFGKEVSDWSKHIHKWTKKLGKKGRFGTANGIGPGGMKLEVNEDIPLGSLLFVGADESELSIHALGKVVWSDHTESRSVGLEFFAIDDDDRQAVAALVLRAKK